MSEEPVVFIPGLNCTAALYASQMEVLGEGHALMIADHRSDDSMAAIAARLLAVAPPRFALCGLSMGGYVAFEVMKAAPERVTRLALLDSRASGDTPEDAERRRTLVRFAEEGRFGDIHGVLWQRLVHPDRLGDKALESTVKGMMTQTGAAAFIRQQTAVIGRDDYRGLLARIRVPTLVLVGEQDVITPLSHAQDMAGRISGSQLTVVPDCGHLSSLERPDVVTSALMEWLNR
jgi:pimeloyl-ACP methyl ester carboxylesterase